MESEIEHFLPEFDFREKHQLFIQAPVKEVYKAFKRTDFTESVLIKILLKLRGITSNNFFEKAFTQLIEIPNQEIVWGLVGRPWKLFGDLIEIQASDFIHFDQSNYAKIAWNFTFKENNSGTMVSTETRIKCTDQTSLKKFRIYWFFIKPFSRLIRKRMLSLIKSKSYAGPGPA